MSKSRHAGTPADLSAAPSIDAAITTILTACQAELVASLRATLDRPRPPEMQALRATLRKLRAALQLFGRWTGSDRFAVVAADARDLASSLAPAGDWEVLLAETLPRHANRLDGLVDLAPLLREAAAARDHGYRQMLARLDGPLPQKLLVGLALLLSQRAWLEVGSDKARQPTMKLKARAAQEIENAHRRQKRHGKRILDLPDKERKQLLADADRLGHAIDLLGPVWTRPKKRLAYHRRVSELQGALGALDDIAIARRLLDRIGSETPSPTVHRAIGAILGGSEPDRREHLARLDDRWRALRGAKRFW